jgi:hypothetical protein
MLYMKQHRVDRTHRVTFRLEPALVERLRHLPNQTAFVEDAIRDALARTCPLCGGRGRLADRRMAISDFRSERLPRLDRAAALKLRQIVRFGRRMAATRLSLEAARRHALKFQLARGDETLMSGRIGQGTGELVLEA